MKQSYKDILDAVGRTPDWWDENGTPRFGDFHPKLVSNIYADTVLFVKIACQSCGHVFHVAISESRFSDNAILALIYKKNKPDNAFEACYGDPPNIGCCSSGATMSSDTLTIMEVWKSGRDTEYKWKAVAFGPSENDEALLQKVF